MKREEILDKVQKYAEKYRMFQGTKTIVTGVSGGADSMCMLSVLHTLQEKYGYHLAVVHVHHGIRGKEADEDMQYVENYCKFLKIPFFGYRYQVETLAKEWHMSCEEAGRKVRYDAFREVLGKLGGGKIAVAHNRDDVSETFLFHLFRGSGIRGICGIPPVRDEIIRPVLVLSREMILEYLKQGGIEYKTDGTNLEEDYTRNKIRNRILPYVRQEINPKASGHIFQTAGMLREMEDYLEMQAQEIFRQTVTYDGGCRIDIEKLKSYPEFLQRNVLRICMEKTAGRLKDITSLHVELFLGLFDAQSGKKINLPYHMQAEKVYGEVRLFQKKEEQDTTSGEEQILYPVRIEEREDQGMVLLPEVQGKIHWKIEKSPLRFDKIEENLYTKCLDYDILGNDFQVRNRRSGDYIIINKQGGRKKIKDYFIDQKIPKEQRGHILLLARGNEIFWVIGYRISERCKITKDTKTAVEITFFPK